MNKLTAEQCREQFEAWCINQCTYDIAYSDATKQSYRSMKTKAAWKVWQASWQALEIALPVLEQQEQKENVTLRDGLAALSAHIDSIGGYNFEALEAYRREEFGQQERGDGWIEWGGGDCPVPAATPVEVKFRKGSVNRKEHAGAWGWLSDEDEPRPYDIIAYRIIPEQPTNQNGEQ